MHPLREPSCVHCGNQFFARRLGTKYCSSKCRESFWLDKKRKTAKLEATPITCVGCGVEVRSTDKRKKFCSRECRWKHFNSLRPTTKGEPRECAGCGVMFRPEQVRGVGRKYCTEKCKRRTAYAKHRDKRRAARSSWRFTNKWDGNWYGALKRDRFTCQLCGKQSYPSKWQTNNSKLVVHHLDGSGETAAKNHSLENLLTVCKPCHQLFHQKIHVVFVDGEWAVSGEIFQFLELDFIPTKDPIIR